MKETLIVILLATSLGLSFKLLKSRHDVVYGKITVDDDLYMCKRWEYIKEKQNENKKENRPTRVGSGGSISALVMLNDKRP